MDPYISAFLQLVQKAQTFRVLDSQRREAAVVRCDIFPDVVLQV